MNPRALPGLFAFLAAVCWPNFARAADERVKLAPVVGKPLTVMTFNIRYGTAGDGENRWSARREILYKTIKDADPDLLGVQEALTFQVKEIQEAVPGYSFVGVGRDDGKEKGEYSGLFYRTERFEKVKDGTFWLSPTPDKVGSKGWDAALPRIATWAILRDKTAPEAPAAARDCSTLLVVNSHWDHMGEQARLESGKLIKNMMPKLHPCGPGILMGDFNTNDNTKPYDAVVSPPNPDTTPAESIRLIDAYREVHKQLQPDEATFHEFGGKTQGRRIDYIFHTPELAAKKAQIIHTQVNGHYPSDHFPVVVKLEWAGK